MHVGVAARVVARHTTVRSGLGLVLRFFSKFLSSYNEPVCTRSAASTAAAHSRFRLSLRGGVLARSILAQCWPAARLMLRLARWCSACQSGCVAKEAKSTEAVSGRPAHTCCRSTPSGPSSEAPRRAGSQISGEERNRRRQSGPSSPTKPRISKTIA